MNTFVLDQRRQKVSSTDNNKFAPGADNVQQAVHGIAKSRDAASMKHGRNA